MKRYIIERDIPGAGSRTTAQIREAARRSNAALAQLAPKIQWVQSYTTGEKVFCIYLAEDPSWIEKHSELSGAPITAIREVVRTTDPTSALRRTAPKKKD